MAKQKRVRALKGSKELLVAAQAEIRRLNDELAKQRPAIAQDAYVRQLQIEVETLKQQLEAAQAAMHEGDRQLIERVNTLAENQQTLIDTIARLNAFVAAK